MRAARLTEQPAHPQDLYQKGNPVDEQTVPQAVPKRADELVVGDRILPESLPTSFFEEVGEVVFIRSYTHHGDYVFVAYWQESGYDSTTFVPDGTVQVYPADTGLSYSRADDGETTQPVAGRVPPHHGAVVDEGGHTAVEVAGGLVEIEPPEGYVATEPVHYRFGMHDTACGLKPGNVLAATADHAKVTCQACIEGLPF